MDYETHLYYLQLIESRKIPIPAVSKLLKEYGSAKKVAKLPDTVLEELGFKGSQITLLQSANSGVHSGPKSESAMEWAAKENQHLVCFESPIYPGLLREIDAAPPILFVSGDVTALEAKHFALVGSRRATLDGKKNAYWIAQELSKAGLQICSGLASGIDSKAHEGALDCGGKTVAVIGTGIDRVYPLQNTRLAQRITENGVILSEFPIGTPPYSSNFPRRNRIISGMARGTLVVEASKKSGSLITARLAMEQNRDVFAVPGPIASSQSRGCHELIKQGAKLVEEPADILDEYSVFAKNITHTLEQECPNAPRKWSNSCAGLVALEAIGHQGCLFEAIQSETKLSIQELGSQLIQLEAEGLIHQEGGRYYRSE